MTPPDPLLRGKMPAWTLALTCCLWGQQPPVQTSGSGPESPGASRLQSLLDTPVLAASRAPRFLRDTPGVVTVLSRDEILAMGARDLIDILRLVPGFDAGSDVQGQIGPSVRGIWGYEGKVLMLWDGLEMSDLLYGEGQMGYRYPVDQISRIEIVRGPGSVTFGDSAEVAVIKITSLQADELPLIGVSLAHGQGTRRPMHQTLQIVSGGSKESFQWRFGGMLGQGQRSDRTYTDASGSSYDMAGQSRIRPLFMQAGLNWGALKVHGIVDQYYLEQRDNLGINLPAPSGIGFRSSSFKAEYEWILGEGVVLTPSFTRLDHRPWWTEAFLAVGFTQFSAHRSQGALDLLWDATPAVNLAVGLLAKADDAHSDSTANPFSFRNGARKMTYTSQAAYAEAQVQGWMNLTLGARYEHFSEAGQTLVPRFALTKVAGAWHLKVLSAQSFRAPSIMDQNQVYSPGTQVVPERTRTSEIEVGWTHGGSLLTLNAFDIQMDRPIVFDQGPLDPNGGNGGYRNQGELASRGFEVDYRGRSDRGFLNLGFAFHRALETGETYAVPGEPSRFLGVADRKATLLAGLHLNEAWSLSASAVHLGPRKGYAWLPGVGAFGLQAYPSHLLLGGQASYASGDFTANLILHNTLNQSTPFIQAYGAGHAPLPGPSREWLLKLRYGF